MHSFLPEQGASMRWAAGLLSAVLACGTSRAAPGGSDGGAGALGNAPPADAGPADAGDADAGPADAGYSGPDCTGMVPAAPGPGYTFDAPAGSRAATSGDGKGFIAAQGGQSPMFWEYDARGAATGSFSSTLAMPQPDGFIGIATSNSGQSLAWFDENGNTLPSMPIASGSVVAPAWQGGALVLGGGQVALFDATAAPVSSVKVAGSFIGGAQDQGGKVLALAQGVSGIWVDLDKGTAGAPFSIGAGTAALARPLAAGGIAVRIDGHWTATLQPGDSTPHPAPAWLADGDDFSIVRGGKAYAIVRSGEVDLVSSLGNFCGSTRFSGQSAIDLGFDGTVIGSSGAGGCTKVFWPALLK